MPRRAPPDPEAFLRENLPLTEILGLRLHLAGPRSGLARLVPPGGTPYWAHPWPGGLALAQHLQAHPEAVAGRRVLDLGTGSGLVALAALRAGAAHVVATDPDPLAAVAARLNAEANGLPAFPVKASLPPLAPGPWTILAGDVFYSARAARAVTALLDTLGPDILVGDIGRRFLPPDRLTPLAAYPVRDVGDPPGVTREGGVFRWRP